MAVTETIKEVKVVLNLTKGSQTIPNCKQDASPAELYAISNAVADLHAESIEKITKVTQAVIA